MKVRKRFDSIVIGSGLGGLVTGLLLAKSGKRVCILEKNNQYGGNLQTFVREKEIFDSGVHYLGSLKETENLGRYLTYLGVLDSLELEQLDQDGFDYISFGEEPIKYPLAQGYENFIKQLLQYFPEEKSALEKYIQTIQYYCAQFPLYNLKNGSSYNEELMTHSVQSVLSDLTSNKKLRAVLLGNGFLYAIHEDSPFYMHALIVNSYIKSSWRLIRGGSQLSKAFTKQLRLHQAKLLTYQEVVKLNFKDTTLISCETDDSIYEADDFVSNMNIKQLFKLFDQKNRDKAYVKRIQNLPDTTSVFSTHLVLKPGIIPYFNHNIYHFDRAEDVFSSKVSLSSLKPKSLIITSNPKVKDQSFASNISMMTYMDYSELTPWKDSFSTVKQPAGRGDSYYMMKQKLADNMIDILSKYFPSIKEAIHTVHTSSPLTYRDYIGTENGTMYGIQKSAENPLKSMISPKTKIKNLYLTGQDIRLHGILGVTITGFMCAAEILGKENFFEDIFNEIGDE